MGERGRVGGGGVGAGGGRLLFVLPLHFIEHSQYLSYITTPFHFLVLS